MKRLAVALVPLALLVSSCSVGQVDSFDDVGPLGADVHGRAVSSDPASLELMLVAKQGGTPTPDDNDIVSPTNQNRWSHAASGCFSVTPSARLVYVTNAASDDVSQYSLGAGGRCRRRLRPPWPPATSRRGGGEPGRPLGLRHDESARSVSQYDVGAGGALSPRTRPRSPREHSGGVAVSPDGGSSTSPTRAATASPSTTSAPAGRCRPRARPPSPQATSASGWR